MIEQAGAGAEAATTTRTFDYDDAGRLISFSVPGGTDTIDYNDRGMPLSITGPNDSSSFGYTRDGLIASRTDAAGTTNYTYDTAGRFKTAVNSTTGINLNVTSYTNMSQPATIQYGGTGNIRMLTYDALHRLKTDTLKNAGGTITLGSITYGYDPNSNMTSKVTTGFAGAASNSYTYDLADRLQAWTAGTTTTAYAFDNSGNRTQNGSKVFTYDARNQLLTQNGGTSYTYTPRGTLRQTVNGSIVSDTSTDAFGQVISQAGVGGTATYIYDALGRVVKPGFKYTGADNTLAQDANTTYTRAPGGSLLGAGSGTGAGSVNAWTDQHSDVVGQFSSTGTALTGSVTYDPLGAVLTSSGLIGHLGYQSEWTESLTGRVNMLARWYNTDTGQFDTRDTVANSPVPDSVNANRFQYGDANPLTTTDPTGHSGWNPFKAAANFVQQKVIAPAVTVVKATVSVTSSAFNYVSSGRAWNDIQRGTRWVADKATKAYSVVKDNTVRWAKKKTNTLKDAYHSAKKCLSAGVGKCVKETAKKAVKSAVSSVKSTVEAIKKDPWKFVATAAVGLAAAVAVGALCATGVGCLILAGAVAGAMSSGAGYMVDVARGDQQFSWSGLAGTMIEGGLDGALSAGVSKFTGGVGNKLSLGNNRLGVSPGRRPGLSNERPSAGRHRAEDSRSPARSADEAGGSSPSSGCQTRHSFDPATRVLLADGATKPIEDVQPGDEVKATDPKTGRSTAKAVTFLHINNDSDLTDVTVQDTASGKKTTLHTTDHHPFWDATDNRWVDAANLAVGHELRVASDKEQVEGDSTGAGLGGGGPGSGDTGSITVTAVKKVHGTRLMRDLTIADIHTYYVLAGDQPVLVHNCNGPNCTCGPDPAEGFPSYSKPGGWVGAMGPAKDFAGPGETLNWEHVVEQSQAGKSGFPQEWINHPDNMMLLDSASNFAKNGYYSKTFNWTGGQSIRNMLTGMPFHQQWDFGMYVINTIKTYGKQGLPGNL